jgi:subtilisin family serine protease
MQGESVSINQRRIAFMNKILLSLAVGAVLTASSVASAQDNLRAERIANHAIPANVQSLKLSAPVQMNAANFAAFKAAMVAPGDNGFIIRLTSPSVAEQKVRGKSAKKAKKNLQAEQNDLLSEVMALDPNARILAQTQLVLNAVFVEVNPSILSELARHPGVLRIAPVANYELDLSTTVPYIGASAVQAEGFDGSGVSVAVLDSGIDYNHAALGGSGIVADYDNNDPNIIEDGTFPTAKVVDGYDFVGSAWPIGARAPDPDPLDDGPASGHGSHVGHIIGGVGGVAPGADLYAVKVCSSVANTCNGIALIQGMEFAVDPDGDGDPSDHVDIINMSLGSDYGQPFDDDLTQAVNNATSAGVLTVASAGNGGNKPYIAGTPSTAATALSVAQTHVPLAALQLIDVDGEGYPSVFLPWSAPLAGVIGPSPVEYGGNLGSPLGCSTGGDPDDTAPGTEPFAPGSLTGLIVLVDRGACNFSIKIFNIQRGGGEAGIIGLVAPGAPFAGAIGAGGPFTIPGYMISQAASSAIKAQIGGPGIGTIDPDLQLPLVGQMVGSSSRGPQNESTTLIKPEIGAPGASVSAIAGTGTGEGPFGGTSGAAPMVAGSAALLLQASPHLGPLEAKATLMNNGDTDIDTNPFTGLAPITRIGGGEVRVDSAVAAPAAAWDANGAQGALSFGFVDVNKETVILHKTVRVRNYSDSNIEYSIDSNFRYADDALNGAVSIQTPSKVKVRAGKDATFTVKMTIKGELLPGNFMNSGSQGADPASLTANEYDGYLTLDDGDHPIHMAWHVLPRKAALVVPSSETFVSAFPDVIGLNNTGHGDAQNDAYSLLAVSPNIPQGGPGENSPTPDLRAVGITTIPVGAGFCSSEFVWLFAVNTWERKESLQGTIFEVDLDIDQDGTFDYAVYNFDLSLSASLSDGRQVTWAENLTTGNASAWFFAENVTNTANTMLLVCGEQVGLTGTDILATNVDMDVFAIDWYNGGPGDEVVGLTVTPLGEQYFGVPADVPGKTNGSGALEIYDFGPWPGNSPELGVLLFTNGDRGGANRGGATQATETLLFTPE